MFADRAPNGARPRFHRPFGAPLALHPAPPRAANGSNRRRRLTATERVIAPRDAHRPKGPPPAHPPRARNRMNPTSPSALPRAHHPPVHPRKTPPVHTPARSSFRSNQMKQLAAISLASPGHESRRQRTDEPPRQTTRARPFPRAARPPLTRTGAQELGSLLSPAHARFHPRPRNPNRPSPNQGLTRPK